jgi:hypothetical protein
MLRHAAGGGPHAALTEELVSLSGLARELFADYLLPFEIVGLLLLVAVIGATVVARRPTPEELAAGAVGLPMEAGVEAAPSYAAWAPAADRAAGGATPASVRGGTGASGSGSSVPAAAATTGGPEVGR